MATLARCLRATSLLSVRVAPPLSRTVFVQCGSQEGSQLAAFERLTQKLRREGLERMMKKRAVRF